ncbi:FadR/GntR family transcriptional regulator [Jatrophihabitans fulvus]
MTPPPRPAPRARLAQRIAAEIEAEVVREGWPVGTVLGSEADLTARYGVSRAVLREAVRIVGSHQVATMRPGPAGGLVVTAPRPDAVSTVASLYLQYEGLRRDHLIQARLAVETQCVGLVARSPTIRTRRSLEQALDAEKVRGADGLLSGHMHDLHVVIARLTGNPVLALFVDMLSGIDEDLFLTAERPAITDFDAAANAGASHRAHRRIVAAIVDGDVELARRRMGAHLRAIAKIVARP